MCTANDKFLVRGKQELDDHLHLQYGVNDFMQEYPPFRIKPNADCHDRLIVLDYGLPTEQAYHCGASSKDAGKKLCAINVILETSMIHPVIDKLLLAPDKQI